MGGLSTKETRMGMFPPLTEGYQTLRRNPYRIVKAITAFCTCSRFSA